MCEQAFIGTRLPSYVRAHFSCTQIWQWTEHGEGYDMYKAVRCELLARSGTHEYYEDHHHLWFVEIYTRFEITCCLHSQGGKKKSFLLTFVGPCIVIYFYSKTNQTHNISNLFYFGTTFYMFRDGLSVHHQESKTVHTEGTSSFSFPLASSHRTSMTYTWCCM